MQNINRLLRLTIEAVFILAGIFLLWVASASRAFFDPRRVSWLVLSAVLVVWGLRSWQRARQERFDNWRVATKLGAASLALAGLIMLSLAWAPFRWVDLLLGAAGSVFVLRGLAACVLLARPS